MLTGFHSVFIHPLATAVTFSEALKQVQSFQAQPQKRQLGHKLRAKSRRI